MKKSHFLWVGAILAVLLVLSVFFLGRTPFTIPTWSVLPALDESVPHILFVGKGQALPSSELMDPLEGVLPLQPVRNVLNDFLPFLEHMDQFAFFISLEEGLPGVYGAFYFQDDEDLVSLKKGELPPSWGEAPRDVILEQKEGDFVLSAGGSRFLLRTKDRMILLADRAEKLERMARVMDKEFPGMAVAWSLHPEWSTHLRLYDAGHLGDILFMGGIELGTVPLSAEISWRNGPQGHDLAWRFGGVGEILSKWGFSKKGSSKVWDRPMTLASPSLLTVGVDLPPGFLERFRGSIEPDWAGDLGFSRSQTEGLLSGPVVFSLGGRSKLFLFSAPGVYCQLFDRGDLGRELVDRLWNVSWSSLAERREDLEGLPFGGGVSRPFSVVGAAKDDRVIVGLLDPLQVVGTSTPARFLPFDPGESFFWFYGDFPELASTLKKWVRLGEYARNVGFEVGEMKETFDRIEKLRSVGRLSLVLRNPFEGWASWTGVSR